MTMKLEVLAERYREKAAEFCTLQREASKLREQREHIDRERRAVLERIEDTEIQLAKLRHDLLNHALGDDLCRCSDNDDERWKG